MDIVYSLIDLILHIDKHLDAVITQYGSLTYLILGLIVFCETGLVVTPFLPGDSLLFAAGAFAARGVLNPHLVALVLVVAAVIGDAVNYQIGSKLGLKVFENPKSKIFRPEYLKRTQSFFERYGGKAIIIARFVPIVRTFAPFLAGVGTMSYQRFALYNISGALLWVLSLVYAGYFFGTTELVQNNFSLVILAIIFISILPGVIEIVRARQAGRSTVAP